MIPVNRTQEINIHGIPLGRTYFNYIENLRGVKIAYLKRTPMFFRDYFTEFRSDVLKDVYITLVTQSGRTIVDSLPMGHLLFIQDRSKIEFLFIDDVIDWEKSFIDNKKANDILTNYKLRLFAFWNTNGNKEKNLRWTNFDKAYLQLPDNNIHLEVPYRKVHFRYNERLTDKPIKNIFINGYDNRIFYVFAENLAKGYLDNRYLVLFDKNTQKEIKISLQSLVFTYSSDFVHPKYYEREPFQSLITFDNIVIDWEKSYYLHEGDPINKPYFEQNIIEFYVTY